MDKVICPYCGEEFEIETCELKGGEQFIDECPNCEKGVEIYAEVVLKLSAHEPEYFKCEVCGKKEYDIESNYLPYEKENGEWEYKALCPECYWKELKRRREKENE